MSIYLYLSIYRLIVSLFLKYLFAYVCLSIFLCVVSTYLSIHLSNISVIFIYLYICYIHLSICFIHLSICFILSIYLSILTPSVSYPLFFIPWVRLILILSLSCYSSNVQSRTLQVGQRIIPGQKIIKEEFMHK